MINRTQQTQTAKIRSGCAALFLLLAGAGPAAGQAADNANPFILPPPPEPPVAPAGVPVARPAAEDLGVPAAFTDNRSVFDLLEVVGRSARFAVLRYPVAGAGQGTAAPGGAGATGSAQGISYRELVVQDQQEVFLGGRSFKAILPQGETSVRLADKRGVLWHGDLAAPRTYTIAPNMTDYQYSPPMAVGAGVGRAASGGQAGLAPPAAPSAGGVAR